jgi:hypothetical protein
MEQYLRGDRLTILSQKFDSFGPLPLGIMTAEFGFAPPLFGRSHLQSTVFDISDRQNPKILSQTILDGSLVSSRAIDDHLYLVMQNNFELPGPLLLPKDPATSSDPIGIPSGGQRPIYVGDDGEYASDYVYETEVQYVERIKGHVLELALPHYSIRTNPDSDTPESTGLLSDPQKIYKPTFPEDQNLLSLAVLDLTGRRPGPISTTSAVTSYASVVYASHDSLYLITPRWFPVANPSEDGSASAILKFALGGDAVDLVAAGMVPGSVLDQFSLDEHEGYLRIATTRSWGTDSQNWVYVLTQEGNSLDVVGNVGPLAVGERIFSVRFMGDRGFVVTFRQVDQLARAGERRVARGSVDWRAC